MIQPSTKQVLDELAMLTHPNIIKTTVEGESVESYVPQVKIHSYYITDEHGHLVPFDSGLIEAGHQLYLYGDVCDILSSEEEEEEEAETEKEQEEEDGGEVSRVPAGRLGPLTEWWFSGFDGTNRILLGVETEYASYFLMSPHPSYEKFVAKVTEQIYLTKLVIEFLQVASQDTADGDSYANLLESIASRSHGKFDQEFLFAHANFVVRQIISYDDAGDCDEAKLLETQALQEFIRLLGLNCQQQLSKRPAQLRITRKDKRRSCNSDRETVTTPLVRQFFQQLIPSSSSSSSDEKSFSSNKDHVSCKNTPTIHKSRKRTMSDRILNCHNLPILPSKASWTTESIFDEVNNKKYFFGLKIDSESFRMGDFVAFQTKDTSSAVASEDAVKFAQIRWMSEEDVTTKTNKKVKKKIFHLLELLESSDTILGSGVSSGKLQEKTLYATDTCSDVKFDSIVSMVKITVITSNASTSNSLIISRDDLTNNNALCKVYYCNKVYHAKYGWFTDGVDELLDMKRFKCTGCIKLKSTTLTANDPKNPPKPIETGSYVLIDPKSLDLVVTDHFTQWLLDSYHRSLQANLHDTLKDTYDENVYTEKYRKEFTDPIKGSLIGLINTYAIGLVEDEIATSNSAKIRLLFRPENIYPDHESVLNCDERELFLTDLIVKVPTSSILGTLTVKKLTKTPKNEFTFKNEFTTDFYIERSYITRTGTICILSDKTALSIDSYDEATASKLTPLASLDLFAGCGGLSLGFEQMNVVSTKWAIERDPVAADSFSKNFPNATVTVKDANQVLNELLNDMQSENGQVEGDKERSKYPCKGEIDVILAGPPCQGFSEINRFTDGIASALKNSLIATTLSFVDLYRPKYVYIENVRNFFKFKESTIFRLTVSCLLYMGYQVSFSLVQAGSLGVPQSRCRAVIIATASGLSIPKMPHLTTSFPSKLVPESLVIQDKRLSINVTPLSLHRCLTVKDAISDLPLEVTDDAASLLPYFQMEPSSSYQKKMRSPNATFVSDQASRATGQLVSSRISLIPKVRGSDWRDLPNIEITLPDGSRTQKLVYTHFDSKLSDLSFRKGVCSCAESGGSNCSGEKQINTLIPWCLVHTATKNYHWVGVYGRIGWDEFFSTTITIPEPSAKQGRVIHPSENRILTVRELARSQGIPDWFTISGKLSDRHRQIGNAVPPPLASAFARCLLQARVESQVKNRKVKQIVTWVD